MLCLHFKRVQWTNTGRQTKVGGHISFPLALPSSAISSSQLDLPKRHDGALATTAAQPPASAHSIAYAPAAAPQAAADSTAPAYALTAVAVHLGGADSGHYATYRRVSAQQVRHLRAQVDPKAMSSMAHIM